MARIKLQLPDRNHFITEIPVRIADINYGGHIGNDSVLSLMHEARVQFLHHFGYREQDVDGAGIIMVDAVINYKAEGFYGMTLRIEVAVAEIESHGCDLYYRLSDVSTGKEIARAKTGIVFFDYETKKPMPTPDRFRDLFSLK